VTIFSISSEAGVMYCDDSQTKTGNDDKESGYAEQCYRDRKCPEWWAV